MLLRLLSISIKFSVASFRCYQCLRDDISKPSSQNRQRDISLKNGQIINNPFESTACRRNEISGKLIIILIFIFLIFSEILHFYLFNYYHMQKTHNFQRNMQMEKSIEVVVLKLMKLNASVKPPIKQPRIHAIVAEISVIQMNAKTAIRKIVTSI